jgi:hypothetical protein
MMRNSCLSPVTLENKHSHRAPEHGGYFRLHFSPRPSPVIAERAPIGAPILLQNRLYTI